MIERRSASGESSTDALNSTVDSRCKKKFGYLLYTRCWCPNSTCLAGQYLKGQSENGPTMSQGLPNIIRLRALCGLLSIDHMVENKWKFCHLPYHNPLMTQSVFSPEMFLPRYSKYPTTEDIRLAMDGKILLFLSALLGFICFNINE